MPLHMLRLALLAIGVLSSQTAFAESYPCQERSLWLESVPASQRDLVLLHVSSNTANKFMEIMKQPNITPNNELWAHKVLEMGHRLLSRSPYASAEVRPLFAEVSRATAMMIRGEVDFPAFKSKLTSQGTIINDRIRKAGIAEHKFMVAHQAEVEGLSNCVLVTAMYNAQPDKPAK
jgi:hypothetical protein